MYSFRVTRALNIETITGNKFVAHEKCRLIDVKNSNHIYFEVLLGVGTRTHSSVAMVQTKVKPILFSGERYTGNWDMKIGAIDMHHRELQANMS